MKRGILSAIARLALPATAAALFWPGAAASQPYPTKPVRLIVPFPPGGANDIVARIVGQRLHERWGRPVVIDNRGGAGGNIGTEIGARAAPDGYTLTIGSTSTFASNVSLYSRLPFDPRKDFAPVALIVTAPNVLSVHPSVPAKSVQELVQLARAAPNKLNYSSFGDGSSAHLVGEMFKRMAGIEAVHIPYKGGGPALAAVIAGEVQMTFSNLSVALPQVKAGKVRGLAVTSVKRAAALPELPTVAESGVPGFQATAWIGLAAPAGTPRALVERINREVIAVVNEPETRQQFLGRGLEPAAGTPADYAQHIRAEIERWSKVIKEAGIKAQ
jgi:tripartite-type tricarboxylate transporter receptor subunit TctC